MNGAETWNCLVQFLEMALAKKIKMKKKLLKMIFNVEFGPFLLKKTFFHILNVLYIAYLGFLLLLFFANLKNLFLIQYSPTSTNKLY